MRRRFCSSIAVSVVSIALFTAYGKRRLRATNDISRSVDSWWIIRPCEKDGVGASCWQRRPQIAFAVCWSDAAWSSSRCDIARFL